MTDVHEFSDHLHTNTVRKEVSEGIAGNMANIDEESVDHINANTANNDLSSGIPEKLTKVVEGSEDTDAHQAVNNDDGVTEIHGTASSRKPFLVIKKQKIPMEGPSLAGLRAAAQARHHDFTLDKDSLN